MARFFSSAGSSTVQSLTRSALNMLMGSSSLTSNSFYHITDENRLFLATSKAGGNLFAVSEILNAPAVATLSTGIQQLEGNSNTTVTYTLTLNRNGSTAAFPYNWTVAGTGTNPASTADFLATSGSGTFAVGETTKTIVLTVTGDSTVEPDETYLLTVAVTGANTLTATGTILNDDVPSAETVIVSGTRRTVTNGMNTGSYGPGGNETVRVWDGSNVNCRNPRAWFHMGRTNPVGAGFMEFPLVSPSTKLRYSILTGITDRTKKDQSGATELFATFKDFAARPDFAGWGGVVSQDGRELTMPPTREITGYAWANGVMTLTVTGTAAGIIPGQIVILTGSSDNGLNRHWIVTGSTGAAGNTFTFALATSPAASVTTPTGMNMSWFVYSDKFQGFNANQPNGYFHKSSTTNNPFSARFANLPAMRSDLGDLAAGDFFNNNWSTVTQTKNGFIPYLLGEGDPGTKLIAVDGDSITSQNGGTWPTSIETGDQDGVLCSVKRALNINKSSWVDISVPGNNADVYTSGFAPETTQINTMNHRHSVLVPMADVVVSRMLHNDRRSYSSPFDVSLRARYESNNGFLRSKMKSGARLGRVTLFASSNLLKFTAISQTGTTVTGTLPTTAGLKVGDQFEVNVGGGATGSLTSNITFTSVAQSGFVITVTVASTVGMTVGDKLRTGFTGGNNGGVPFYDLARDDNGLVTVTGINDATTFTVAADVSQNRSGAQNDTGQAVRRIKTITGNQITWDHPVGLEGAGSLGSGGIDFNTRWTVLEQQVPPNDDSDFSDMSNVNKGGVKRLNNLIMRRGDYASIPYGGAKEIDWGVDNVSSVQTDDGKWRVDGTPYWRAQDPTHPGSKAHAVEAPGLATQLAAKLN